MVFERIKKSDWFITISAMLKETKSNFKEFKSKEVDVDMSLEAHHQQLVFNQAVIFLTFGLVWRLYDKNWLNLLFTWFHVVAVAWRTYRLFLFAQTVKRSEGVDKGID